MMHEYGCLLMLMLMLMCVVLYSICSTEYDILSADECSEGVKGEGGIFICLSARLEQYGHQS